MTEKPFDPGLAEAPDPHTEDAVRAAFARHARDVDFAPLDPDALRAASPVEPSLVEPVETTATGGKLVELVETTPNDTSARSRRRRPLGWLAAAALMVVAVPLGIVAVRGMGSGSATSAVAGSGAAGGAAAAAATPQPSEGPMAAGPPREAGTGVQAATPAPAAADAASAGSLGTPMPGYRFESTLDVVAQVPASWGYAVAPSETDCGSSAAPATPYVGRPEDPHPRPYCPTPVAPAQQTHLEWRRAVPVDAAGEKTVAGWVFTSRIVGSAYLTVVHRPGDPVAATILDSARQVSVDQNGCAAALQASDGRPIPGTLSGTITGATLCQYSSAAMTPNLRASTRLTAQAASSLVSAIEAGPTVATPRLPAGCTPDLASGDTVVVRFEAGSSVKEYRLALGCRVPTFDDGARYREATKASCSPLFALPLRLEGVTQGVEICVP